MGGGRHNIPRIAHLDPIFRDLSRIAEVLRHNAGVGLRCGGRSGSPAPLELVVLGLAGEIATVPKGGLFIERVAREHHLEVADIELFRDLKDLNHDGIALRLLVGIAPVSEDHRHVARALAGGGKGVTVHRGVGISDERQVSLPNRRGLRRIDLVKAEDGRVGNEGLDLGIEGVDCVLPSGLV